MIFSVKNTYSRTNIALLAFFIGGLGCAFLIGGEIYKPRGVSAYQSLSGEG